MDGCDNGGRSSAGRVPGCDPGCRGFESHRPPHQSNGPLAQLVEQETLNLLVVGSIPTRPTIITRCQSILPVPLTRLQGPSDPLLPFCYQKNAGDIDRPLPVICQRKLDPTHCTALQHISTRHIVLHHARRARLACSNHTGWAWLSPADSEQHLQSGSHGLQVARGTVQSFVAFRALKPEPSPRVNRIARVEAFRLFETGGAISRRQGGSAGA